MKFTVEYTKRAMRDLKSLSTDLQKKIIQETIELENDPFPYKKKVKKIQGIKFPCYRLRIDHGSDSFRVFFGIEKVVIFILGIVSKKNAEKILKNLKNIEFPPEIIN
jgi:mRNA-degrading endonuclease RelE of RelBE toxin-antitoxin system